MPIYFHPHPRSLFRFSRSSRRKDQIDDQKIPSYSAHIPGGILHTFESSQSERQWRSQHDNKHVTFLLRRMSLDSEEATPRLQKRLSSLLDEKIEAKERRSEYKKDISNSTVSTADMSDYDEPCKPVWPRLSSLLDEKIEAKRRRTMSV